MGEAPRGAAAGHKGPTPMDLGQAQGQGQATYTSRGGFAGQHGGRGGAGGGSGPRTCHYCHQPGHFMLSCPKLKRDMAARKARRSNIIAQHGSRVLDSLNTMLFHLACAMLWQHFNA